jgi:hypothetical protein
MLGDCAAPADARMMSPRWGLHGVAMNAEPVAMLFN